MSVSVSVLYIDDDKVEITIPPHDKPLTILAEGKDVAKYLKLWEGYNMAWDGSDWVKNK